MANQGLFQGGQHSKTLLAQRREIASDAAKGQGASRRAETAGDLLLDLDHPNIALGKAIVKGHGEVVQEQQHRLLVRGQAIKQIASRRLFASSSLACFWWRIGRVGPIAFFQQGGILHFPVGHLQRMQTAATLGSRLLDGGFDIQKQRLSSGLPSPGAALRTERSGRADDARYRGHADRNCQYDLQPSCTLTP